MVKDERVRGVGIVATIDLAGNDDAHGRLLLFHGTNLHGRSVRPQKERRRRGLFVRRVGQVDVERVHVVPDRMKLRDIQRLEVVVRRFNFRPLHNGKTNGEEDVLEFLKNLADEVMRADGMNDARERKV